MSDVEQVLAEHSWESPARAEERRQVLRDEHAEYMRRYWEHIDAFFMAIAMRQEDVGAATVHVWMRQEDHGYGIGRSESAGQPGWWP